MTEKNNHGKRAFSITLIIFIVINLGILALAWSIDYTLLCAILILISFVALLVLGLLNGKHNRGALDQNGEAIYFLGYLVTIAALVELGIKIHKEPTLVQHPEELLFRGAFAITSTVGGLLGMFICRVVAQSYGKEDDSGSNIEDPMQQVQMRSQEFVVKTTEQLENLMANSARVLAQFEELGSEHAVALGETFKRMEGLGGSVELLRQNVAKIAESLALLEKSTVKTGEELAKISEHASVVRISAVELTKVSDVLSGSWQKVSGQIQVADTLTGTLTGNVESVTGSLAELQKGLNDCQAEMQKYTATCKTGQAEMLKTFTKVSDQATQIGKLADSVTVFERTALQIASKAPQLNSILENLHSAPSLNGAVENLLRNVQNLNTALGNSANFSADIGRTSRELSVALGTLSTEIRNQLTSLDRSATPLLEFAGNMSKITPNLDKIVTGIASLQGLTIKLSEVQKSLGGFQISADQATLNMRGLDAVAKTFVAAAAGIGKNSNELTAALETLAAKLTTLDNAATPLTDTLGKLTPNLAEFQNGIGSLQELTKMMSEVQGALDKFQSSAEVAALKMATLETVVRSFIATTDKYVATKNTGFGPSSRRP